MKLYWRMWDYPSTLALLSKYLTSNLRLPLRPKVKRRDRNGHQKFFDIFLLKKMCVWYTIGLYIVKQSRVPQSAEIHRRLNRVWEVDQTQNMWSKLVCVPEWEGLFVCMSGRIRAKIWTRRLAANLLTFPCTFGCRHVTGTKFWPATDPT